MDEIKKFMKHPPPVLLDRIMLLDRTKTINVTTRSQSLGARKRNPFFCQ